MRLPKILVLTPIGRSQAKRTKDKPIRQDDRGWDIEDDEDEDKDL